MVQRTVGAAASGTETSCDPGRGRRPRRDRPARVRVRAAAVVWPALLTAAAESAGDRVAIFGSSGRMSCRELDEWSSRWARLLIDHGVGPGEVVAIAGSGSAASALAVWAVIKSGAAWLPLDPALPPAQMRTLLATARPVLGLGAEPRMRTVPWLEFDEPDTVARVRAQPAHPVSYLDRVRTVSPRHPAVLLPAWDPVGRVRTVVLTQAALGRRATIGRDRLAGGTRVPPADPAQSVASWLAMALSVAAPNTRLSVPPTFGPAPAEGPSTPPTRAGAPPVPGGTLHPASTPPAGTGVCAAGTELGRSRAEVRGEAAAIDAAVTTVPGVQFAVTMPRHLPSGRSVWVSYLCPAPGADLDLGAVRRHLSTRLPAHRRPAAVAMLTPVRTPTRPGAGGARAATPPLLPSRTDDTLAVMLPLRPGGGSAPLFCIHPLGGLAWSFAGLAAYLDPDRPLYGLQSPALGADPALPATMEHWARRYLHEIRRIQPHGPYHLLGWSLGGMLAHTLAVLLRQAGQTVHTVAMLDAHTRPPVATPDGGPATTTVLSELGLDTGAVPAPLTAGIRAAIAHARTVLPTFTPGRFDGDLLYFAATRDRPVGLEADGGWRRHVAGAVHVEPIDATHTRMTTPAALARIGPVLDRWMNRPTDRPAPYQDERVHPSGPTAVDTPAELCGVAAASSNAGRGAVVSR